MKLRLQLIADYCDSLWVVLKMTYRAFSRFVRGESFVVAMDSEAYRLEYQIKFEHNANMIAWENKLEASLDQLQKTIDDKQKWLNEYRRLLAARRAIRNHITAAAPSLPPGASAQTPAPPPVPPPPDEVNDRS